MDELFTVIMAGGRGERLWPKSNNDLPKQFTKIVSEKTMLEETVVRCNMFSPRKRIYISTLKNNLTLLKKIMPRFPKTNIITEPIVRDTACAILLSTLSLPAHDQDVIVFIPADHYLKHLHKFKSNITTAFHNTKKTGKVTLIGITPNFPSTEYGYLKVSSSKFKKKSTKPNILHIEKFVEKPDFCKAQAYIRNGNYLWNSGIFMFSRGYLLNLFRKHTPELFASVTKYLALIKSKKTTQAINTFMRIKKISFDYAIAEKITDISCVRSTFFWDDVGSWESFFRIKSIDKNGNIVIPKTYSFLKDAKDNLCIIDDDRLLVLNGVKELIVVSNDNKLYIAHRKSAGNIKAILRELENEKKRKKIRKI